MMATMCKPYYPIVGALLVAALDTCASVVGILAQCAQNASKHVKVSIFECKEPSHAAFKLGIAALILLALAHLITNFFSGCASICSAFNQNGKSFWRKLSNISLLCSWLTFLPVSVALGLGTYPNHPSSGTCGFSHLWLLYIGGLGCFVHGMFCIGCYSCAALAIRSERKMIGAASQLAFTAGPVP